MRILRPIKLTGSIGKTANDIARRRAKKTNRASEPATSERQSAEAPYARHCRTFGPADEFFFMTWRPVKARTGRIGGNCLLPRKPNGGQPNELVTISIIRKYAWQYTRQIGGLT
jgi:hypothetical protein